MVAKTGHTHSENCVHVSCKQRVGVKMKQKRRARTRQEQDGKVRTCWTERRKEGKTHCNVNKMERGELGGRQRMGQDGDENNFPRLPLG